MTTPGTTTPPWHRRVSNAVWTHPYSPVAWARKGAQGVRSGVVAGTNAVVNRVGYQFGHEKATDNVYRAVENRENKKINREEKQLGHKEELQEKRLNHRERMLDLKEREVNLDIRDRGLKTRELKSDNEFKAAERRHKRLKGPTRWEKAGHYAKEGGKRTLGFAGKGLGKAPKVFMGAALAAAALGVGASMLADQDQGRG